MTSAVKKGMDLPATLFDGDHALLHVVDEGSSHDLSSEMYDLCREQEAKQMRRKKNKSKTIGASVFNRATLETEEMIRSGEWDDATPRHMVALYALMHEKVYGIEAVDLDSQARYKMTMMANTFIKREFSDNVVDAVEFFRWMWGREMGHEKYRRENATDGRRLTAYLMFSNKLLPDFRLHLVRKQSRR